MYPLCHTAIKPSSSTRAQLLEPVPHGTWAHEADMTLEVFHHRVAKEILMPQTATGEKEEEVLAALALSSQKESSKRSTLEDPRLGNSPSREVSVDREALPIQARKIQVSGRLRGMLPCLVQHHVTAPEPGEGSR